MRRRGKGFVALGIASILILVAWRIYRHIVPAGATWYPPIISLTYGPVDGGVVRSADGRFLRVVYHDFGAAHSGNFWTWVVRDRLLTGKRVVAEGYSSQEVGMGGRPFPVRRNADGSTTVTFVRGKYDNHEVSKTIPPD